MKAKLSNTDIQTYLKTVPKEFRDALEDLRKTIISLVPDAEEIISYQIPTFKYKGRMLVSYAAFKKHCSFFPGASPIAAFVNELKGYETSKGTIKFTPDKPLSKMLVKKIVKFRLAEIKAKSR